MVAEDAKRKSDGPAADAKRQKHDGDSKGEVMSLEQVLAKRKEENKAPKLKFVSKNDREKNAVKEADKQKAEQKKKAEEASKRRKDFLLQEEIERERERQREREEREKERKRREEERQREREEREKERLKQREEKEGLMQTSSLAEMNLLKLPDQERRERQAEKELELIKRHYLGMKENKKKMQKPSEKFRNIFNFEWNADDDTMRGDNNPLYTKRLEPQLLFGRGYRAGIDVREQRKNNSFYEELIAKRAEYSGEDVSAFVQPSKEPLSFKQRDIEDKDINKTHWTEKPVADMTTRDWRIFREDFQIFIRGGRVPVPMRVWSEGPLPWELLEAIHKVGYARPTPIQMQAIPIACQCRDLIAVAETGSGKTAAYVLPMLSYVKKLPKLDDTSAQDGPYGIILAPSRELVIQIEEEARKFAAFCDCRMVSVVGGRDAEQQAFTLRQGVEICMATPGRLCDSLDKRHTVLNQCTYVVIDEADKMVDLGFEDYVRRVLLAIPASNMKADNEVWQIKGDPIHKFLWHATDVNTGATSVTKARHCRIDVVQYLSSHMEVVDVNPMPKLKDGEVIPNAEHPSDHFPVFVNFMLKDGYEKHRECARAWLECVAGREKVHPLSNEELRDAFEFFDRDRDENIHLQDLEEACFELRTNFHVDVPTLLLECFPDYQISFEDFLRAYEASLRTDRLRAVGDLECAFRYFAGDAQSIHIDTLEAAFREITPVSFSDDEVKDMIGRVSGTAQASVHLHDFCEVVCKATFPNREEREALVASTPKVGRSPPGRMGTKEIGHRLHHLQKAVSGKGLQVDLSPASDGSNLNKFFEDD